MQNLVKKIQTVAHQHNLWQEKSKIVVGVSGGPDSVCLLHILLHLQKSIQLELVIAHVNYGLRGKESERDEKFVRELATKNNLEIFVLQAEIISQKNLESSLRDMRYDFFEKIRSAHNFDLIAVAHNLDDQAETYLMRILRGAGLHGLSAMKFRNRNIIRPLLSTTRNEIIEHLKEQRLKFRIDRTNLETLFLRNKIRNKLIPYLEKKYNPNLKKTLFDSTISITEDDALLTELTQKAYQTCLDEKKQHLSVKKLLSLHPALQRRILLQFIIGKKLNSTNITLAHIEEIFKVLRSTKGKNQVLSFQGLKMTRKGDKVTISKL
jgi:tRNA(Ile)-lysidine synthase